MSLRPITVEEDVKHLADIIHTTTCRDNHMDGCDWDYHNWEKHEESGGKMGYGKNAYKKKAKAVILALVSSGTARDDIDLDLLETVFVAATTHHGF
jgi:hypothetical protein